MRALSIQELELVVGGYDSGGGQHEVEYTQAGDVVDFAATSAMTEDQINTINNAANTMGEEDLNTFANQQAQGFGIPIGPFRLTPIYNPFSGPNDIRKGFKIKAPC